MNRIIKNTPEMNGTLVNVTSNSGTTSATTGLFFTTVPLMETTIFSSTNFTTSEPSLRVRTSKNPEFPLWFVIGLVILGILTLLGNGIVVYLVAARPKLRSKTNFMVMSLAFSDIVVGVGIVPSFLACMYEKCDNLLTKLFYDAFLFVSVCNLCCITFDRFLAVTKPLRYHMRVTRGAVIKGVALSWIIPSVVALIPVTWQYTNTSSSARKTNDKIYYTVQVVIFVFCPCLIMLIVYAVIVNVAWKQSRHIHHLRATVNSSGLGPDNASVTSTREAKATLKVFGTVVLMFVACWAFSAFRTIVTIYDLMRVPENAIHVSRLLLVANSAVNPIIYAMWKQDIKNEMRRLVRLYLPAVKPSITLSARQCSANSTLKSVAYLKRKTKNGDLKTGGTSMQMKSDCERSRSGVVNRGLESVEEITTTFDMATSMRPWQSAAFGIDNIVPKIDGME